MRSPVLIRGLHRGDLAAGDEKVMGLWRHRPQLGTLKVKGGPMRQIME